MRYKISKHIQFSLESKCIGTHEAGAEVILIADTNNDRKFFINPTIKLFIEKFTSPATLSAVAKELAAEADASFEKVKKLIIPFFNYCKRRHFIVAENSSEEKIKESPLFNLHTVVDQYKIESLLNVNDDTDVYKAINLSNEASVIIKLIKNPGNNELIELKREFNFLKSLYHTGVVPEVYDFIIKENHAYFIQSFIEGLSLPQFIHRHKKVKLNSILIIIQRILSAFAQIHAAGVVHGDIHSSNIIVTSNHEIKILDFGLALNNNIDKNELVNFGGAYFFMPPERINKSSYKKFSRRPDFYSDVFQLGIVLYMLMYDAYPFNGITWEELATEIKEKPVEFPATSKYGFIIPTWFQNIIKKCVARKPKQRFADAQHLLNAYSKNLSDAGKIRSAIKI